jgi:hypothetical protein
MKQNDREGNRLGATRARAEHMVFMVSADLAFGQLVQLAVVPWLLHKHVHRTVSRNAQNTGKTRRELAWLNIFRRTCLCSSFSSTAVACDCRSSQESGLEIAEKRSRASRASTRALR